MTDLSKLSDDELMSLYKKTSNNSSLSHLSDEELMALYNKPDNKSVGDWEVEGKDYHIDSVTGMINRPQKTEQKDSLFDAVKNIGWNDIINAPYNIAQGLYDVGKSVVKLPKEVLSGEVSASSDDSIRRSMDLATLFTPASPAVSGALRVAPALSRKELKNAASRGYNKLDELGGEIDPAAMDSTAENIKGELTKEGYRKSNVPKTFKAIKELNSPTGETSVIEQALADPLEASMRDKWGVPLEEKTIKSGQLSDLTSIRKVLGKAKMDYSESDAARRSVKHIDNLIEEVSPEAANVLKTADADYAGSMRGKRIDKISEVADRASRKGMDYDVAARNRVYSLLNSEKKSIGFSPQELKQLEKISEGTGVNKIARLLGKMSPNNLSAIPTMAAGGAALAPIAIGAAANPYLAAIPLALGMAGKKVASASTRRQLGKMNELSRSLAPSSKAQGMRRLNPTGNAIVDLLLGAR